MHSKTDITLHFKFTLSGLFSKRPRTVTFRNAYLGNTAHFVTVYAEDGNIYHYNADEVARVKEQEANDA